MGIDIRQMVVNAKVRDENNASNESNRDMFDAERFRAEIMEACAEMIRHYHQRERER